MGMNSLHKLVSKQLIILLLLQFLVGTRYLARSFDFRMTLACSSNSETFLEGIISCLLVEGHLGVSVLRMNFGCVPLSLGKNIVNGLLSRINAGVLSLKL